MLEIIPFKSKYSTQVLNLLLSCFYKDFKIMFGKMLEKGKELLIGKFSKFNEGIFIALEEETQKVAGVVVLITRNRNSSSRRLHPIEIFKNFGVYGFRVWLGNFIETEKVRKDTCYIESLAVDEGFRNQGLGLKLLETSKEYALAKEKRIVKLTLWVLKSNNLALRLYNKFGFKIVKEEKGAIIERILGENESAYFMEMKIR